MENKSQNDVIIRIEDLVTHYGDMKVLDGVSFDVRRGEVFVVVGGSGCGTSTLLKHMCGLLRPTATVHRDCVPVQRTVQLDDGRGQCGHADD